MSGLASVKLSARGAAGRPAAANTVAAPSPGIRTVRTLSRSGSARGQPSSGHTGIALIAAAVSQLAGGAVVALLELSLSSLSCSIIMQHPQIWKDSSSIHPL